MTIFNDQIMTSLKPQPLRTGIVKFYFKQFLAEARDLINMEDVLV